MDHTGASGSAHGHGITAEVGFGNGGKYSVFFVAHVDELDLAIAAQRVDDRIESIPDNAVAAFDTGVRKHLPQNIRNFARHR
jgi:hypothetical protein